MPHIFKKPNRRMKRFSKRTGKKLKEVLKDPIKQMEKETDTLRRTEKIQQDDIDEEKVVILEDREDDEEKRNELTIRKKMELLLNKLPKQDKLRNIMDEKKKVKNDDKMKSNLKVNEPKNLVDRS